MTQNAMPLISLEKRFTTDLRARLHRREWLGRVLTLCARSTQAKNERNQRASEQKPLSPIRYRLKQNRPQPIAQTTQLPYPQLPPATLGRPLGRS